MFAPDERDLTISGLEESVKCLQARLDLAEAVCDMAACLLEAERDWQQSRARPCIACHTSQGVHQRDCPVGRLARAHAAYLAGKQQTDDGDAVGRT